MANGVVATSKALKEEGKVLRVSKQAGKHVRQRDQLGYISTFHLVQAKAGFWSQNNIKSTLISNDNNFLNEIGLGIKNRALINVFK